MGNLYFDISNRDEVQRIKKAKEKVIVDFKLGRRGKVSIEFTKHKKLPVDMYEAVVAILRTALVSREAIHASGDIRQVLIYSGSIQFDSVNKIITLGDDYRELNTPSKLYIVETEIVMPDKTNRISYMYDSEGELVTIDFEY